MRIAATLMLKNEETCLPVTLASIREYVDVLIVFDTGSTDQTIPILEQFSQDSGIPLFLKHGEFVDFSTSRNHLLNFADIIARVQYIDFLLLLDSNDELRGGPELRQFCSSVDADDNRKVDEADASGERPTGWFLLQHWEHGTNTKYLNIRLIRPLKGWRYSGVVHEWISRKEDPSNAGVAKAPDSITLFQDRFRDNEKSTARYASDIALLLKEHQKDPNNTRTLFYLAQSYRVNNQLQEAYQYYTLRSQHLSGFGEEVFHAFQNMGELALRLKMPWQTALGHFMEAFACAVRIEPLIETARFFISIEKWSCALLYLRHAAELPYPHGSALFVNNYMYEVEKYELLKQVCDKLNLKIVMDNPADATQT
jgi:glycosyltransferase involved in cell wall biosynthesis